MNLPPTVKLTSIGADYPVFEIHHPLATARVAQHGAHLLEWTPAGQKPVLYLSPQSVYRAGKAVRGGVPVCWPWFGPHETDATKPAHGFARNRFWDVAGITERDDGVTLVFTLQDNDATRALWPQAFRATMTLRLGAELHLALEVENTDAQMFAMTGALHAYFAVGDINAVRIEGLDGAEYLDTVGPHEVRRQHGDIIFNREVDRNYASDKAVLIHDSSLERVISVSGSGSRTTVVWNPWIEKSKKLTDLPDGDYRHFVCVETANAWRDRITLAPGARHVLGTSVSVHGRAPADLRQQLVVFCAFHRGLPFCWVCCQVYRFVAAESLFGWP